MGDRANTYNETMSGSQYLVHMANDIGNFFRGQHQRDMAIAGIANHIRRVTWTLAECARSWIPQLQHGEQGLDELPREALRFLAEHPAFKAKQQPGGDAG